MLLKEERERYLAYSEKRYALDLVNFGMLKEYVLSDDCTADIQRLLDGDYDLPLPHRVLVRKANTNRRRTLFVQRERQNFMLKYLAWHLHEYEDIYSDNLYSFRLGLKSKSLFNKILQVDPGRDLWVAKTDVRDYFFSINPKHLIPMLEKHVGPRDPQLLAFLTHMLTQNRYLVDDVPTTGPMGGLPGNPVAMIFGNVYLTSLDAELKERSVLSCRYSDDIAAFVQTQEEAEELLDEMRRVLHGLDLELNERKTAIAAPKQSVELLGLQICDHNLDVSENSLAKTRYKLKRFAHMLVIREQRGEITREQAAQVMVNRVNRYFYGRHESVHRLNWESYFFTSITRSDSLRDLDRFVQDLIRYVGTGKKTKARYRMTYEDMTRLGYKPLVHEYYRFRKDLYLHHQVG